MAGVAIAQHGCAPSIGGQVSANGCRAPGSEVERKEQAHGLRGLLDALQAHAGLGNEGFVNRVLRPNAIEPREAQHELAARGIRCCAPREPGVAALGHDGNLMRCGELDQRSHGLGGLWKGHRKRPPGESASPVGEVGVLVGRIGEQPQLAEQGLGGLEKSSGHHRAPNAARSSSMSGADSAWAWGTRRMRPAVSSSSSRTARADSGLLCQTLGPRRASITARMG